VTGIWFARAADNAEFVSLVSCAASQRDDYGPGGRIVAVLQMLSWPDGRKFEKSRMNVTLITTIAGLAVGSLGTWLAFRRDRVRVRVVAGWTLLRNGEKALSIEIVNRSYIPITITQVGVTIKTGDPFQRPTHVPLPVHGDNLPTRMEARTSTTIVARFDTKDHVTMSIVHSVFERTACGCRFSGTGSVLREAKKNALSTYGELAAALPTLVEQLPKLEERVKKLEEKK
jgi:hypothetical protein